VSDIELLHKPKAEPVHRLEVFTGAGRRRTWSAEQKERIVGESHASGEAVSAVARRHGLTPQQLFGWRRAARRRANEGAGTWISAFAPVIVEATPACSDAPTTAPARAGGLPVIEIVIGAIIVRVARGTDAETLQAVLRAVRTAT
jgi:transposase